jgi:alpha-D-xyloside xylohydrolase
MVSKRWCQFGLLSSHSRLHGSGAIRAPWVVDDEACVVLSKFTKLKNRLEPYLTSESITGVVEKGHPLMRAMFLEFPEDRTVWDIDQQYMLGSNLLVAPVFGQSEIEYYAPAGRWVNILTGVEVTGPAWVKESHSMMTLPLLLRQDTGLIVGQADHGVRDSIAKRGFTLVLSSQTKKDIKVKVALRGGKSCEVEVKVEEKDGKVTGLTATLVEGDSPFEVIVLGNGKGLDNKDLPVEQASNGVAKITL